MNQRDLEVMNILYTTNEAMTGTDITECKKGLTQSTVIAVLRKLLKEGLIEVAGVVHSGKVLSRTYRPTAKAKEALLEHFDQQYNLFCNVISPDELLAFISRSRHYQ